jgi:septal ring factor EnvC (AmiA/AmiB activator)
LSWSTESTDTAKLNNLNTEIASVENQISSAIKSKSYSIAGRSKTNHDLNQLRDYLKELKREKYNLENKISIAAGNGNKKIILPRLR